MRHLKAYRKLNRTHSHRSLMLRNLVTSLLEHERVETTVMKAKEARRVAERMITLGKQGTLHARRRAASILMKKTVVKKLFDELAPRYANREGGYTRILRVGYRKGDGAPLAFLELVAEEVEGKKKVRKKTAGRKAASKAVKGKKRETAARTEKEKVETEAVKSKGEAAPTVEAGTEKGESPTEGTTRAEDEKIEAGEKE